jgi:hypothetical protein
VAGATEMTRKDQGSGAGDGFMKPNAKAGIEDATPATVDVGHKRPPTLTRFAKGVSGNPKGRPKSVNKALPHDAVLGRKVKIRMDGRDTEVTAEEAFLLHIGKAGMDGDGSAARCTLEMLDKAQERQPKPTRISPPVIKFTVLEFGSVSTAIELLRIARRLDAFRDTARIMLEPWIVEAALKRLGSRQLTQEEQETVYAATRTPSKVVWPDWWVARANCVSFGLTDSK